MIDTQDLQDIADRLCQRAGADPVDVTVKRVRKGRAHPGSRRVSVPSWALDQGREYATYYVIHEVCHILSGQSRHNAAFQNAERKWLIEFGMIPVYARAYAKQLLALDGQTLWKSRRYYPGTIWAGRPEE